MRSTELALALAALLFVACSGRGDDAITTPSDDGGFTPAADDAGGEAANGDAAGDAASDPDADGVEGEGDEAGLDAGFVDATPIDAAGKTAAELLAGEAKRELSILKESTYSHTTSVDESIGKFDYDCSGFVGYALAKVLPPQLSAVEKYDATTRPLAKDFEAFFGSLPTTSTKSGWRQVARAIDLAPGDVVAWLKPPALVSSNTGHVMIVRGAATANPKRADEILVPITDSTSSPHGSTDSRYPSGQGLGTGTIGLIVDASGAPTAYRWTGGVSTQVWATTISLGRPE